MAWIQDQNGNPMQVPDAQAEIYSKYPSTQGAIQGQGWQVINGIIYARPGAQVPADIQGAFRTASPQELSAIQDPNDPMNNANGSFGEALKLGAGFAGAAYGLGNLLGPATAATTAASPAASAAAGFQGAGADAIYGAIPEVSGATGGMAAPAVTGGISTGTALSGAGTIATLAGSGAAVDGVQAGVDAANSTSGYSQLDPNASATSPGGSLDPTTSLYNTLPAAAKTALGRILNGTGTPADYASVLGAGGSALLGAIGSSQQQAQLKALSDQYIGMGAPSRDRYEASFQPGFTMSSDPGYQDSLDAAAKASSHALSINGNPGQSPNAWAQSLEDLQKKAAYPALQNYRNQNAATGGIANFSAAAPETQQAAIGAGSNVFGAIGKGIANITSPPQTLSDWIAANGGGNIFKTAAA